MAVGQPYWWPEILTRRSRGSSKAQRGDRQNVKGYDNAFGFDGAPILYSWPSEGSLARYPVDETNIEWSTPHLRTFLDQLSVTSGATTIHLIAHSMGNRAVVNALVSLQEAFRDQGPHFKQVVLTAPDIDADVLRQLSQTIRARAERVTLYMSPTTRRWSLRENFMGIRVREK
jgi:esterase/lipase superfamily enzyme